MPEGFELVESEYDENLGQKLFVYQNNKLFFNIVINENKNDAYLDSSSYHKEIYNYKTYYINNKNDFLWYYDNLVFNYSSNISKKESLKIINSIN